jgi:hypothetical protein
MLSHFPLHFAPCLPTGRVSMRQSELNNPPSVTPHENHIHSWRATTMEYQILQRGWHSASRRFKRALEAAWFEYLEHLGFTPQAVGQWLTIGEKQFSPALWLPEWHAFIYILSHNATRDHHVNALCTEAFELVKQLPHNDSFLIFGAPDELDTYIEIYSLRSDVLQRGVNRWTIGGNIDKAIGMAYFWMLFSADGRGYIPNTPECFPACYCKENACELCFRIESFLPVEAYGAPFRTANPAHRIFANSVDTSAGCKISERQRYPWRTHG